MYKEQKYLFENIKSILNIEDITPLFIYSGVYTYHSVNAHLVTLKQYLESHVSTKNVKRNIYNILVECIENINRHGFEFKKDGEETSSNYGYVIFASEVDKYSIWVGNFVLTEDIEYVKKIIDEIAISSNVKLREMYRDKLSNNQLSLKQGMGIGILDVALRSREPIKFITKEFNETTSFFSLQIKVTK